jgi:glycosyltransferase involved in cell wall biosynthesis
MSHCGICIVEPGLQSYHGHFYNYSASVNRGAGYHQLQFKVLASIECLPSIMNGLPVCNVFPAPHTFFYRTRFNFLLLAPLGFNLCTYKGLLSKQVDFLNEQWIVFGGTADHTNLFALAAWLRRFKTKQAPTLVLTLRLSFYRYDLRRWSPQVLWYWPALKLIERLARTYRIRLVTDSAVVADESRKLTSLPVHVLPIPHMDLAEMSVYSASTANGTITMTSLGSVRDVKGFHILAEAIARLYNQRNMDRLCFRLQTVYHKSNYDPVISGAIDLLKTFDSPAIRLMEQQLSEIEYKKLIQDSDIILIPYFQYKYYANTSGTFAEALAAGKPVIVTEGTWMSAQLEKYGAGVTFRDRDVDDLARAIIEARDNYSRLAQQARERQPAWVAYHNPANFVSELLRVVDGEQ